jgi:transposase-like protein
MGQILHKRAKTTHEIRAEIQESKESAPKLAKKYSLNIKTIYKWQKRKEYGVEDKPMGRHQTLSVLTEIDEFIICEFRRLTKLALDDCFISLKAVIPKLTRSNLSRCLKRNGLSVLPKEEKEKKEKKTFKNYEIGYVHVDIAEIKLEKTKLYLFVAIERVSKFAYVELYENQTIETSSKFLKNLIEACPFKIHRILTDNGAQFTYKLLAEHLRPKGKQHLFDKICSENGIIHKLTQFRHPWTNGQVERFNRTIKEETIRKYHYGNIEQLKKHIYDFVLAYNCAKKLKSLKFITPYEKISLEYQQNSKLFKKNPDHYYVGLNT